MKKTSKGSVIISFILLIFIPILLKYLTSMEYETASLLGIFASSLYLWLAVDIGWPSVMCFALLGMLPSIGFAKVFILGFGSTTFSFLMFTFICTYALSKTSIIKNISLKMLNSSIARRGGWYFVVAYIIAIFSVGLFVSPTVLFVILLPIYEEICKLLNINKGDRTAQYLGITMIFTIAMSAGATPISHVFSIMAMGIYHTLTGDTISYMSYIAFALPISVILLIIWFFIGKYIYRPQVEIINNLELDMAEKSDNSHRDWWILIIFLLVVVLWLAPDILNQIFPKRMSMLSEYGLAFPPIVGTLLLSIISIDGKPLINLTEAFSKGVHWPSLMMSAATLSLGSAFTMEEFGIVNFLGENLLPLIGNLTPFIILLFFASWTSIQTNLSSNMVTVSVVTPIAISVFQSLGKANEEIAIVCCLIGLLSSLAYATPPAMPYVAIIIGSGWAKGKTIFYYGLIMMLCAIVISSILGYLVGPLLM